jgi:hypothetical protein
MSRHRYDWPALRGDYARAAIGLAISVGALWVSEFSGFTGWLFGIAATVFGAFGLRTILRGLTNYELTEASLTRSYELGFGRVQSALEWKSMRRLSLRFFPAKRDRSEGWMEATLAGDGARMRLDSTLGGFDAVIRAAAAAAKARGLPLNDTTRSNLAALGIVVDPAQGESGAQTAGSGDSAAR